MSNPARAKEPITTWEAPAVKATDEAAWRAWVAKGRVREKQGQETRIKALKWGSIVALLIAAGLSTQLAPYEIGIRFVLAAAAAAMTFAAFKKRQYALGAVFAALVVLYNPVAPVFSLSGNWQRALVVATAIPFAISLAWRDLKGAPIA
jgi:hypothetical protein